MRRKTYIIGIAILVMGWSYDGNAMTLNELEHMLRAEVKRWYGTPYTFGGTSKYGVDCSGFVQAVIENLFDARLPRYSGHQAQVGQHVSRRQLRTGDLIFFKSRTGNHVGLYLGRYQFAHSCKSKGVTISNINGWYWRTHYWTARRIFR